MNSENSKGFTLIELLVVISIIGFLSSIVLASLNTARAKARDAFRLQSMRELQTALNLYYHDHGSYPLCTQDTPGNGICAGQPKFNTALQLLVDGKYIASIPSDPITSGSLGLRYEYMTKDNVAGWATCDTGDGNNPIYISGKYDYVIKFGTEKTQFNLPELGIGGITIRKDGSRNGDTSALMEYCILPN